MENKNSLIQLIKDTVRATEPEATLILYASYVRGDRHDTSNIDLLVLVDKERITRSDHKRIKYLLYKIEFATGTIISPLVFSKQEWYPLPFMRMSTWKDESHE